MPFVQLEISDVHLMHVTATPTKLAAGDSFTAATATPAGEVEVRQLKPSCALRAPASIGTSVYGATKAGVT